MNFPKVSVVITTKNRKSELDRAIESVMFQNYENIEIIIVDDGSECDFYNYTLNKYSGKCMILRNEISKGACNARNKGIDAATGVFIAGLDDDDEFTRDRIYTMVNEYRKYENAPYINKPSLICSHAVNINDDGSKIFEKEKPFIITKDMMLKTNFVGSQVLVKKSIIQSSGLFDENLVASQDHDMWLRIIEKHGPGIKLRSSLYICHDSKGISRVSSKKLMGLIQFYKKHKSKMNFWQKLFNVLRGVKMIISQPSLLYSNFKL
ncbi:glycosyltransferase [Vibrio cholerae]|nr:glycosyltransferase [Vibrio cholerae]